jgi:hypothetical protein
MQGRTSANLLGPDRHRLLDQLLEKHLVRSRHPVATQHYRCCRCCRYCYRCYRCCCCSLGCYYFLHCSCLLLGIGYYCSEPPVSSYPKKKKKHYKINWDRTCRGTILILRASKWGACAVETEASPADTSKRSGNFAYIVQGTGNSDLDERREQCRCNREGEEENHDQRNLGRRARGQAEGKIESKECSSSVSNSV